eukprot:CAMPEP_0168822638 /NCGR_PEP_ID=MMETSP0726-20121227/10080_1 /TAXON_ID=265536 /ORGANISM="Amphiprora sp., Strain CCMP467" /LENGTH=37 /DNA_ID= /DNA_START= /DNA_END= /DNA_ORIENTATION=
MDSSPTSGSLILSMADLMIWLSLGSKSMAVKKDVIAS